MRFLKNDCQGGNENVLLEMGGTPGMGRGVVMEGWEIFEVSLAFLS